MFSLMSPNQGLVSKITKIEDFVNVISSNAIVSCLYASCHLLMCSPEVLDRVRCPKQVLSSRNQESTEFLGLNPPSGLNPPLLAHILEQGGV